MSADGIDEAAAAFDKDISAEAPAAKGGKGPDRTEGPPERLFERVGDLEVDEESPSKGGGDEEDELDAGAADQEGLEEGEEEEGEAEGDDDDKKDEEEDEGSDAEFLNQEVSVVVDGQEQAVTVKEALEGYVRTQTFHKRMNEVNEARTAVQQVAADTVQNYEYIVNLGKEIQAHLETLVPPEPNWDEEFKKNPVRAREMQKYYEQVKAFRADLQKKMGDAAAKQEEDAALQTRAYAQAESRRFDQLNAKQWAADPKRKGKDLNAMRRTALSQGFSEEEISQVYDSRMLQILLKASRYDRMIASRPKAVIRTKGKRPVQSGSGPARTKVPQKGINAAMKRLNQTGHIEDAAVVFDHLIAGEAKQRR